MLLFVRPHEQDDPRGAEALTSDGWAVGVRAAHEMLPGGAIVLALVDERGVSNIICFNPVLPDAWETGWEKIVNDWRSRQSGRGDEFRELYDELCELWQREYDADTLSAYLSDKLDSAIDDVCLAAAAPVLLADDEEESVEQAVTRLLRQAREKHDEALRYIALRGTPAFGNPDVPLAEILGDKQHYLPAHLTDDGDGDESELLGLLGFERRSKSPAALPSGSEAFAAAGIHTAGDFLNQLQSGGDEALLEIPGIGCKVLSDLKKSLRSRGYDVPKSI